MSGVVDFVSFVSNGGRIGAVDLSISACSDADALWYFASIVIKIMTLGECGLPGRLDIRISSTARSKPRRRPAARRALWPGGDAGVVPRPGMSVNRKDLARRHAPSDIHSDDKLDAP